MPLFLYLQILNTFWSIKFVTKCQDLASRVKRNRAPTIPTSHFIGPTSSNEGEAPACSVFFLKKMWRFSLQISLKTCYLLCFYSNHLYLFLFFNLKITYYLLPLSVSVLSSKEKTSKCPLKKATSYWGLKILCAWDLCKLCLAI